jgi:hypothetical protein
LNAQLCRVIAPVIRFRVWLAALIAICAIVASLGHAQESTAQPTKREASSDPDETPTPTPSPKKKKSPAKTSPSPKATPKSSKTPAAKKKRVAKSPEDATPSPSKKKQAKASPSAKKKKSQKKSAKPIASPKSTKSPSVAPVEEPAVSSPTPTLTASATPIAGQPFSGAGVPQVNIEKSGFLGDQGYEPPPPPAPRRGWWPWSRQEVTYRYLSRSVRSEIDRAPVMRRRWQFIIVHNSGTRQGSARVFDYYHRRVRRMQNGLAYHFVIGNGTSTGDGEIEVGDRWRRQINGGHVHSDYLNNIALGICLVGDFNRSRPTSRQLEACEELIRYLRKRCGKIDGRDAVVRPHREVNPPRWATDCPGDAFPYQWFRKF